MWPNQELIPVHHTLFVMLTLLAIPTPLTIQKSFTTDYKSNKVTSDKGLTWLSKLELHPLM